MSSPFVNFFTQQVYPVPGAVAAFFTTSTSFSLAFDNGEWKVVRHR